MGSGPSFDNRPMNSCHPEGRVVCAPKDLNVMTVLDSYVEILRPSSSDGLRVTRHLHSAANEVPTFEGKAIGNFPTRLSLSFIGGF